MDDLDELLTSAPTDDAAHRATVYRATTGVLRRRRWVRRGTRLGAVALAFAAGAVAVWMAQPEPTKPTAPTIVADQPAPPALRVNPYQNDPPEKIERWATTVVPEKRSSLYRMAGDRFLERGDQLGALRCYRQALAGSTDADLVIQPGDDTWLMMSLKVARRKEKTDARP